MKTRSLALLLSAVLSTASVSIGQTAAPVSTAPAAPKVEVFTFTPVGDVGTAAWVGQGIQESLQGSVSNSAASLVMPSASTTQPSDPMLTAKAAGANYAIVGTFQINAGQVRANGHLVDVATGTTVGGFSATGKQDDLFKVEDALGAELSKLLPSQHAQAAPLAAAARPDPTPVAQQIPQPIIPDQTVAQPVYTYLPDSNSTYGTPVVNNNYYGGSYVPDYSYGYTPYVYGYYGIGYGYYGGYYGGRNYYNRPGYRGYTSYPGHYGYGTGYRSGGSFVGPAAGFHTSGSLPTAHFSGGGAHVSVSVGGGGHGGGGHR